MTDIIADALWVIFWTVIAVVLLFLGYHEWWVAEHCATVLGTRVCQ